jgi:sugar phosphate isomerase/epimerase
MTKPTLAAQLYTVRAFTQTADDFAASLDKIRAIGYTAVQVSAIGPIPDAEVQTIADDTGLTICNTHVRPADALWNDLDAVIEQHHLWNCQHVAIGSMPGRYRAEGEVGFRRFAAEASQIGEKLHAAGLTFSYHNHSFEFVRFGSRRSGGARTGLDIIFEESDPRYLQAELDTYWVQHGGGDPTAWIERLKRRMPVVHLKDMVIVDGEQAMAEIGEGNLNWPAILQACRDAEVAWYAVEQDVCQRDPFESLKISYENLKAMGLE